MDRRLFLAGCAAATPASVLAPAPRATPRPAAVALLRTRLVNCDLFGSGRRPGPHGRLALRRDHGRSFDPNAIAVVAAEGEGLGYLPPARAGTLAALMDVGLDLWAEAIPDAALTVAVFCAAADLAACAPDAARRS